MRRVSGINIAMGFVQGCRPHVSSSFWFSHVFFFWFGSLFQIQHADEMSSGMPSSRFFCFVGPHVSFFVFCIGLLTMFSTYIVQPTIALVGFVVMALAAYIFVSNTRALLNAENINEWNFKQVYTVLRNKDVGC